MIRFSQARSLFARSPTARSLLALAAVAALAAAVPLQAEPPAKAPATTAAEDEQMQQARKLHGEYVALQERLTGIQEKTIAADPELQKQQQAMMDLVMAKMDQAGGSSAKDDMAALQELEQKLRSEDTPEKQREALMAEYQEKAMAFRNVQMQALKDPEVQQSQESLMEATVAAMKKQDPQTEELMQQMRHKQEQMKRLMEGAAPPQ
jgi:hypothetical protein